MFHSNFSFKIPLQGLLYGTLSMGCFYEGVKTTKKLFQDSSSSSKSTNKPLNKVILTAQSTLFCSIGTVFALLALKSFSFSERSLFHKLNGNDVDEDFPVKSDFSHSLTVRPQNTMAPIVSCLNSILASSLTPLNASKNRVGRLEENKNQKLLVGHVLDESKSLTFPNVGNASHHFSLKLRDDFIHHLSFDWMKKNIP